MSQQLCIERICDAFQNKKLNLLNMYFVKYKNDWNFFVSESIRKN